MFILLLFIVCNNFSFLLYNRVIRLYKSDRKFNLMYHEKIRYTLYELKIVYKNVNFSKSKIFGSGVKLPMMFGVK